MKCTHPIRMVKMSVAASTEVTIMNIRSDMTRGWKSSDVEGRDPISVSNEVVLFAPDVSFDADIVMVSSKIRIYRVDVELDD